MITKITTTSLLLAILFFFQLAEAKVFKNAYVSFQLPERWECKLEGTEWVCQNTNARSRREAIIILTAKEAGPADTIPAYEQFLRRPRSVPDRKGRPTKSKVKHVRRKTINGHTWVDGWHDGSEIPSYYTTYMATTKQSLGILVTFSAHKRFYSKYSTDFKRAIESLNVIASNNLLQNPTGPGIGPAAGGGIIGSGGPGMVDFEPLPEEPGGADDMQSNLIIFGIILAALGGFYYFRRKKKKS